ncbi:MAG: hypothetical protein AAGF67_18835, partial [Verrucomicrobiota bacterium]
MPGFIWRGRLPSAHGNGIAVRASTFPRYSESMKRWILILLGASSMAEAQEVKLRFDLYSA